MKSIHKLVAVAVLALSSAGLASAQTGSFFVTGSTAYRASDVLAELALCGSTSSATTSTSVATYWGSSITGATYSVVENSSGSLKFFNFFNGSIAGDQAVFDATTQLPFPNATDKLPAQVTVSGTGPGVTATGGDQATTSTPSNSSINLANPTVAGAFDGFNTTAAKPTLAFSDVSFNTANQIMSTSGDHATTSPTGPDSFIVGIVPFVFVVNGTTDVYSKLFTTSGSPAQNSPTLSMDPQKFTWVWGSGASATLSFFTGNPADEATTIFPLGRDVDSGTRSTALAETGYGLNGSGIVSTAVTQFYPYDTAAHATANSNTTGVFGNDSTLTTGQTIGALNATPANTVDQFNMAAGDNGYNSGGNLDVGMDTAFTGGSLNTVLMTYLGVSDATTVLSAGNTAPKQAAQLMGYCGTVWFPYTVNKLVPTATTYPDGTTNGGDGVSDVTGSNNAKIYEGKYTFWSYENLYSTSASATAASDLASKLTGGLDEVSSNGVTFANMAVNRSGDGQNVQ
jgi:hypothetical protein